jgi:hypothetical protein
LLDRGKKILDSNMPGGKICVYCVIIVAKVMIDYNLGLAWNWTYDADFITLFDKICLSKGLSLLKITPDNLLEISRSLLKRQISFQVFLDRASDTDIRFLPIVQWARHHAVYRVNPYEKAVKTWDKACMHLTLISAGLHTPYTIILPSYKDQMVLPPIDLSPLGSSFIIKPSYGGGGDGVIAEVTSLSQVLAARQEYPTCKYLLQFHIVPTRLESRPAWFRVIYCAGKVYPCWWDTDSHIYTPITDDEKSRYALHPLYDITLSLACLYELDLFSTEIALTLDGLFVVVDYVNDQIDLRLRSQANDGVPDEIVQDIAERLVELAATHCFSSQCPINYL